ncbi:hypothetical protein AAC387_Pa01g4139 [Persea americana]
MLEGIAERVFLFRIQLQNRRICNETFQILESLLASKDVKSLIETRSILKILLRSEAVFVLREISEKSIDSKIPVVEFFINAFALVGDVESCLALKYEVLVLRELKYMNHHSLQVSHEEWLTFADDSLNNGFYSIAVKGYENALLCIQRTKLAEEKSGIFTEVQVVGKIKELRDMARTLVASQSVQAQTARYLKRKCVPQSRKNDSCSMGAPYLASSLFRSGIKKRNIQKLRQCQNYYWILKALVCITVFRFDHFTFRLLLIEKKKK